MRDLRHWHIATAECLQGRHKTEFTGDFLAWERSPHAYLTDLRRRPVQPGVGTRQGSTRSVTEGVAGMRGASRSPPLPVNC